MQLIIDVQHIEVDMLLKHHMVLYQSNVVLTKMVPFIKTKITIIMSVIFIKLKILIVVTTEMEIKNKSTENNLRPKTKKTNKIVIYLDAQQLIN